MLRFLLFCFVILNFEAWAQEEWTKEALKLMSQDQKVQNQGRNRLKEMLGLYDIVKKEIKKTENRDLALLVIGRMKFKDLLSEIIDMADQKPSDQYLLTCLNSLADKVNNLAIKKFYQRHFKQQISKKEFFTHFINFYDYFDLKIKPEQIYTMINLFPDGPAKNLGEYLRHHREKYSQDDYSEMVNKSLMLKNDQLQLELLEGIFRLREAEILNYKIDYKSCRKSQNAKVKKVCESIDKII